MTDYQSAHTHDHSPGHPTDHHNDHPTGHHSGPLLTIITVTLDSQSEDFAATAASLTPLLSAHSRQIEWLVIPGREPNDQAGSQSDSQSSGQPSDTDDWQQWATILPANQAGIYAAMDSGLDAAAGRYVWWLNGGDQLASASAGDTIMVTLAEQEPDFLYGDSLERDTNGKDWYKPSRHHSRLANGMFTHHQAMIYGRHLTGDNRYGRRFQIAADYGFTIRYLMVATNIVYVREALCRFQPGGLSNQQARLGRQEQQMIRREFLGTSWVQDRWITGCQQISQQIRQTLPGLWERLRRVQS
ncbi:MAG: hypothetical protein AAF213_01740 [Pseudomonadota bacterium]